MWKNVVALLVLNLLVILLMPHLHAGLKSLLAFHGQITNSIGRVLSTGSLASTIKQFIALIIIPIAIGTAFTIVYLMFKLGYTPHLMLIVWATWLVLATAVIMQYSVT